MEFKQAVDIIIKHEGGSRVTRDPNDPGGTTKFGISQRSYPDLNIEGLTRGHAEDIYRRDYWYACSCEGLPPAIRLAVFDCAVNQGAGFAAKTLQSVARVKRDGKIGAITMKALYEMCEIEILQKFLSKRMERYLINKKFSRYGKGWLKRLIHISVKTRG